MNDDPGALPLRDSKELFALNRSFPGLPRLPNLFNTNLGVVRPNPIDTKTSSRRFTRRERFLSTLQTVTQADIPVVHFSHYLAGGSPQTKFIDTVGQGLERFGFVAIAEHGIDESLLTRAYALAKQVFALPESIKRAYETPEDGRQRGYTSFGIEHAKDQALADLKEFWHIGRDLDHGHALYRSKQVAPNRFPTELPEFATVFRELFAQMDRFANTLLGAIGVYLGRGEHAFTELVTDGNSVLRVIHYPPVADASPQGAVRAAQHEDINLITILPVSTQPGLELLTHDGEWLDVAPPPGVMVCDTGDMMQLLTDRRLPSTTHRVVNPRDDSAHLSRYSMPFFCHPHPDRELADGVLAKDFLMQRLREIGVA